MRKFFRIAMIGAMVLGAQSMVFASDINSGEMDAKMVKSVEVTKVSEAQVDQEKHEELEKIEATLVTDAVSREMTEEEKVADAAKVKEICEALNIQYDENTVLGQLFETLTDEQFDQLVDLGIIQVMEATPIEIEAIPAETEAKLIEMQAIPTTFIAIQK